MSDHHPDPNPEHSEGEQRNVEIPSHDEEVARLRSENARLEETLLRAKADLMNIRKRQIKDLEDARRRTIEGITAELLPVLDTFRYALSACDAGDGTDTKTVIEGIRMVQTLLAGTLERHGLTEIESGEDRPFDPAQHEAVGVEPAADKPDGVVLRVLQPGYSIGDRILRPAKVVVSGDPSEEPPAADADSKRGPDDGPDRTPDTDPN